MSDDPDDRTLLASAYLDDEATADERARVEADPEALAEVSALGDVRTVLDASIDPVSLSAREGHLAAALDVFERMSDSERRGDIAPAAGVDGAAGAAVTTPLSSSDAGRHRGPRNSNSSWLLGAAAALLVLVGIGAVVRGGLGGGSDDSTVAEVQDAIVADEPATEAELIEKDEADEVLGEVGAEAPVPADGFDDDDAFAEGAELNDTSGDTGLFDGQTVPADDADDDAMDDDAMEDDAMAEDGDVTPSAVPDGAEQPSPPPESDLVQLIDVDELAAFASPAARATTTADGAPDFDDDDEPPIDSCESVFDIERRAGFAEYQGIVVMVGIDLDNGIVYAYTVDDCQLVASTGLPDDVTVVTQP